MDYVLVSETVTSFGASISIWHIVSTFPILLQFALCFCLSSWVLQEFFIRRFKFIFILRCQQHSYVLQSSTSLRTLYNYQLSNTLSVITSRNTEYPIFSTVISFMLYSIFHKTEGNWKLAKGTCTYTNTILRRCDRMANTWIYLTLMINFMRRIFSSP